MTKNLGTVDRGIRVVIGVALLGLFLLPGAAKWWGLLGLIPLGTAAIGWCPLYVPFGLRTNRRTDAS